MTVITGRNVFSPHSEADPEERPDPRGSSRFRTFRFPGTTNVIPSRLRWKRSSATPPSAYDGLQSRISPVAKPLSFYQLLILPDGMKLQRWRRRNRCIHLGKERNGCFLNPNIKMKCYICPKGSFWLLSFCSCDFLRFFSPLLFKAVNFGCKD